MRKSFKDSLKALEADIQFANTLASDYHGEFDGACLQMRLSYSPAAQFFLFIVQWTDCHLAGALGLLRILIYKVILIVCCNGCNDVVVVISQSLIASLIHSTLLTYEAITKKYYLLAMKARL
ncbi:hypothetical protein HS088_TW03G01175 [Tripterygium wilfordii]|uniref:Uncharacterized protein n=1 Tax=Tripterygium wilfordii TaxID=458696 RepID=A0A7J7DWV3_TRIWF|nr:hypothetical protein HS088_TW03G01175 [Tripterygium wilfordii]